MLGRVGLVKMEVATDASRPLLEAGLYAFQFRLVHSVLGDTIGRESHCAVELLSEHRGVESGVALACRDEESLVGEVPGCADGIDIEEVTGFGTAVEGADLVADRVVEAEDGADLKTNRLGVAPVHAEVDVDLFAGRGANVKAGELLRDADSTSEYP